MTNANAPQSQPARMDAVLSSFRTTLWTTVMAASDPDSPAGNAALARLCETYWFPVYAFILKRGNSPEHSKDLTQAFFAKLLQKNLVGRAERARGKFRSFLMTSVENFLRDEHDRNSSMKKGGGQAPLSLDWEKADEALASELSAGMNPTEVFEKEWARILIEKVLHRLSTEHEENGKGKLFEQLQSHLWGDSDSIAYSELSKRFGVSIVNLRVYAHRMRQRFREILREEIAHTVDNPIDIDSEMQYLRQIVRS